MSSAPFPTSIPKTLVLGAGELGEAVLSALSSHPLRKASPMSVLLRSSAPTPARQALLSKLHSQGIDVLEGDIQDSSEEQLAAIFRGFDTVVGCIGMVAPKGTQLRLGRAAVRAATRSVADEGKNEDGSDAGKKKRQRLRRYFPWQFGVDYEVIGSGSSQDLFSEQLEVRALLRGQSELEWVIVSTGLFLSFLFEPAFGVVTTATGDGGWTVTALGKWENGVTVTTPRDIGRVVAEIVLNAKELKGIVYTAGDTITYGRLADVLQTVLGEGNAVRREVWTVDFLKQELAQDPGNGMKKYRVVFAEGKGVSWDEKCTFNHEKGIRLQNVEEWAKDNLAV
ncbi:hypothetical protein MMC09_003648 [Bachmanniomyces sp. S44760]|nr:hypothetical protein [Bachmanniomyces sp. S44760]